MFRSTTTNIMEYIPINIYNKLKKNISYICRIYFEIKLLNQIGMLIKNKWKTFITLTVLFISLNLVGRAQCTANFSHTSFNCNSMAFIDLSVAAAGYVIVEWYWDFDDGFTSSNQNPSHSFANPGTYNVMLAIAADSAGYICRDTIIQPVITLELPTVFFTWSPEPTMLGNPTNFYGTSGNTITSWYWDFGDGNFATTQDAIHMYSTVGTYYVELTVTDIDGCVNSIIHMVTIGDIPALDYHWNFACEDAEIQFTVDDPPTDIPAVVSWLWDFGDGGASTDMDPIHVYITAGTYNVSLTIVDTNNATNTVIKPITVNPLPSAIFSIDSPTCSNNHIQFNDNSTTPTGFITEWYWDFGDGSDTTVNYPDNPDVTHIYNNTSTFIVTLTITNSDSCTNTSQNSLTTLPNPIANFSFEETCYNDPVYFTDLSTQNGGSTITSWSWDFGDPNSGSNNTSTLQNPTHVYTEPDTYTTSLTITNINGCTDTTVQEIIVDSLPFVDFTMADDSICLGEIAVFTGIGTDISTWYWEFGDGGNSVEQSPSYLYSASGTYLVTLTVTGIGPDQCQNSISYYIYVNKPIADFIYGNSYLGNSTYFFDMSYSQNSYITEWYWEFGDDSTATTQNPIHEYQTCGIYDVTLSVIDFDGCSDIITNQIEVLPLPFFPDSNAIWNTIGHNSLTNEDWRFRYGIIGDTIISIGKGTSYTYNKVYSLYDSTLSNPYSTYFGAIRTTIDKEVFILLPDLPESLLYDYSLEVGDTIWFNIGGSACYDGVSFWEQSHFKVVTEKDSVELLDNQYHTRWFLEGSIMNDIWIEGVGSTVWFGLFNPIISDATLCGDSYSFACYKHNNTALYIDNPECDKCFCYLLTGINEPFESADEIEIYPNPTKDIVNISINSDEQNQTEVRIYNSTGHCVFNAKQQTSESIKILVKDWKKGLYIVRFLDEKRLIGAGKFVIE